MANNTKKLGVIALASVVVSSMVGGGIYSLPQNMAAQASVGAVIIAWVVTGIGMFFLANSFRILSDIRPDLKAGIYMYGREGFGSFVGFLIAWGYWLCQIFGNVGYAVITMDALNYFFPPYFAGGNTIYAIIGGSILMAIQFCGTARDTAGCRDQYHRYDRQTHSVVRVYHYYDFRFSYR